ncbi:hypothetical protein EJ04DRAFT_565445 [Polyplosphaeria fusca]|uniref:Uncharacterized protein n=1 Tax=Polyplosphaeria fusca TaxID=682080 RepID=A0A9P4QV67_9PLEO|nr:hypothetical protein EJ04DRAFT_565445 [Polyplosphaeria fusca]
MKLCIASLVFPILHLIAVYAIDCAPPSGSFTIKTAKDVSDIRSCSTFAGSLVVAADGPVEVALDGIKSVSGNIDIENVANLQLLSSQSLEIVSSFTLNNLPLLSNLSFPVLKNFTALKWSALPKLKGATMAQHVDSEVTEVSIFNTTINSLDWLTWPVGGQLNVSYNDNLETISIPYSTVNAGSTLTISNNAALQDIHVDQLGGIYGALQISSNPSVGKLDFKSLETIGGYVQLSGSFKNVSMQGLNQVTGALNVESKNDITALCSDLSKKADSSILKGHYDCTSNQGAANPTPTITNGGVSVTATGIPSTAPNSESTDNGSKLSTGAKIGIAMAGAAVLTAFFCAVAFVLFRRRMRAKVQEIEKKVTEKRDSIAPSHSEADSFPPPAELKELESLEARVGMPIGKQLQELEANSPHELEARHGKNELSSPPTPLTPISPARSWYNDSINSDGPLVRHELAS